MRGFGRLDHQRGAAENDDADGRVQRARGPVAGPFIVVLRMPYTGNRFSLYVLLPDSGAGLAGAYRALDRAPWQKLIATPTVHVVLPRFTIKTDLRFDAALKRRGMARAFSRLGGFQRDGRGRGPRKHVKISDVRQATYIAVSEEGTEGAAVTSAAVDDSTGRARVVQFVADHPFLAVLRDDRSGAILFMGQVTDP